MGDKLDEACGHSEYVSDSSSRTTCTRLMTVLPA